MKHENGLKIPDFTCEAIYGIDSFYQALQWQNESWREYLSNDSVTQKKYSPKSRMDKRFYWFLFHILMMYILAMSSLPGEPLSSSYERDVIM